MTSHIVKRSESDLCDWLSTETGFISGLCSYDGEPIVLEPFQLAFLQNTSRFRWVVKARQTGYSFSMALEALARCHLRDGHTAVFVSYNQDDAKEKVLTARQVFEEMPLAYQKRLVVDSKTELVFESNTPGRRVSRIISVPSKAPRGKKGDIYLDELAHLINDRQVYTGSTALILRSNGQLSGCSSPLGRRGIFWEIAEEELRKYPHHTRQSVPWWLSRFFCHDVATAAKEAPLLSTEERVERFGRAAIVARHQDNVAIARIEKRQFGCAQERFGDGPRFGLRIRERKKQRDPHRCRALRRVAQPEIVRALGARRRADLLWRRRRFDNRRRRRRGWLGCACRQDRAGKNERKKCVDFVDEGTPIGSRSGRTTRICHREKHHPTPKRAEARVTETISTSIRRPE